MIPRLLDIEFLPLKPTFKLLRLLEAGGNFPSLGWKFSVLPLTSILPTLSFE